MAEVRATSKASEVIARFLDHCHRRRCPPKTTIIRQGDPSKELYYIVSGSVTVLLEDKKGHEIVLAYLNAGDFFGEIGLFHENLSRSALVRARTPCEIASISYEKLKSMSSIFPDLLFAIATQLAMRLRGKHKPESTARWGTLPSWTYRVVSPAPFSNYAKNPMP